MSDQPNQTISLDCLAKQAEQIDDLRRKLAEAQKKLNSWPQKIFEHKHLDPVCVEKGCQSLFLKEAQARIEKLEAIVNSVAEELPATILDEHIDYWFPKTRRALAALAPKEDDHAD